MKALSFFSLPFFFWACLRQATSAICAGIYKKKPFFTCNLKSEMIILTHGVTFAFTFLTNGEKHEK